MGIFFKYRFLIIALMFILNTHAQKTVRGPNRIIDSLKLVFKNAKHDTIRCYILNAMIEAETDDNLWPGYNDQLKTITEENIAKGGMYKIVYLKYLSDAYNNIGFINKNHGEILTAIDYFKKSLNIQQEIGDSQGMAISLNNIGGIFDSQGDIPKALDYYHQSLKIFENIGDKKRTAYCFNNIGLIYKHQGEISKALEYYQKCVRIYESIGDKSGVAVSFINIGSFCLAQKDTIKGLDYFQKSLKILEEIGEKSETTVALNNIGFISEKKGDLPGALEYYYRSLNIQKGIRDKEGIALSLNNIARTLLNNGQTGEALRYAIEGMETSKELGFPVSVCNLAYTLKTIYQKQNKYKEAFEMYKLEIKMRDSVNNRENQKTAIKNHLRYDYEKKEAVIIERQEKERALANEKNSRQQIVIFSVAGGLVLVVIFAFFVFRSLRITREQKLIIEQKQRDILDSIHYAKRIQTSLLPTHKFISKTLIRLNKN